jgi:hypothetical protein
VDEVLAFKALFSLIRGLHFLSDLSHLPTLEGAV